MLEKLNQLLKDKIIDKFLYDTYLLFELEPKSKAYLNDMITDSCMEHARAFTGAAFAWQDGRRSVWRMIQENIYQVCHALKDNF
ncbi:hypothetical protein [Rickettsiella massiliensis]|uniref:hypothetical protein n=1 Tax=Rickettsiella massiliensis TaxID=676517 RepID=UPI00029AB1EF|nr:hypothetical protein [Rickettsiella massiliensis]